MGLEPLNSIKDATEKDPRFLSSKTWRTKRDLVDLRVYSGLHRMVYMVPMTPPLSFSVLIIRRGMVLVYRLT